MTYIAQFFFSLHHFWNVIPHNVYNFIHLWRNIFSKLFMNKTLYSWILQHFNHFFLSWLKDKRSVTKLTLYLMLVSENLPVSLIHWSVHLDLVNGLPFWFFPSSIYYFICYSILLLLCQVSQALSTTMYWSLVHILCASGCEVWFTNFSPRIECVIEKGSFLPVIFFTIVKLHRIPI